MYRYVHIYSCPGSKYRYLVRVGLNTGTYILNSIKSSPKRTPRALPLVQNALYMFVPEKPRYTPSLSTLLDFQLFFVVFNQRPSIFAPYAPYVRTPTNGETLSTLHTPNHATRRTSNTRI